MTGILLALMALGGVAFGALLMWLTFVVVALVEDGWRPHLGYLRYVFRHKAYVYRAGRLLGVRRWRLLVHDRSKFGFAEWRPYVRSFYGYRSRYAPGSAEQIEEARAVKAQFQAAWLHHIHANPHHWEHWVIPGVQSSFILTPHAVFAAEMLADWIGAGSKINAVPRPSLDQCIVETVRWYASNAARMHLRQAPRLFIEQRLVELAADITLPEPNDPDREIVARAYDT